MSLLAVYFLLCLKLVYSCPDNCLECTEEKIECVVQKCSDELPFEYTDFLYITGKLCIRQKNHLNGLSPNTIIVLENENCDGLRNCQSLVKNDEGRSKSTPLPLTSTEKEYIRILPIPVDRRPNERRPIVRVPTTPSTTTTQTPERQNPDIGRGNAENGQKSAEDNTQNEGESDIKQESEDIRNSDDSRDTEVRDSVQKDKSGEIRQNPIQNGNIEENDIDIPHYEEYDSDDDDEEDYEGVDIPQRRPDFEGNDGEDDDDSDYGAPVVTDTPDDLEIERREHVLST